MSDDKDLIQFYVANYLEQLNKFPGTWVRASIPPHKGEDADLEQALLFRVVEQTITALELTGIPYDHTGYSLIMIHELEDKKP